MALAQNLSTTDRGFADRVAALFRSMSEARQRRKVFRQTLGELRSLTSRELADLGLNRSMITRVAAEAAYGKAA
ncbi:DUF1127 domain-containing protein [Frigidibacter sp. MR17.14]|uniref:DUF1127 domain-containing protein n=1 Tax=Frigidibacter sp. MR17.14 TaxID=3126509 RepID=UPI0030131B06